MKILSWNVNGIRALDRKGALEGLMGLNADILCLQETKAAPGQLSDKFINVDGFTSHWNNPVRKGYAGVLVYTRQRPLEVGTDFPSGRLDTEGRFLSLEYENFTLMNVYFPNGGASEERLRYKLDFYDHFLRYVAGLKKRPVVLCGDLNTAHRPIDLARPRQNASVSGFLPEERERIDRFLELGFVDTFRARNPDTVKYSWWDYKTRARERDVGWRIDYVLVSSALSSAVKDAFIISDMTGSDHCPVGVDLEVG